MYQVLILAWSFLGYIPVCVVGIMAWWASERDNELAWIRCYEIIEVLGICVIGLVVVAGAAPSPDPVGTYIIAKTLFPFVAFLAAHYLILRHMQIRFRKSEPSSRTILPGWGCLLGMLAYLWAFSSQDLPINPGVLLFVNLYLSGLIGEYVVGRLTKGRAHPIELGAGELDTRIRDMAARKGVNLEHVLVYGSNRYRDPYVGAIGSSIIILSEALLRNLSKSEVDASIAHELGHCANHKVSGHWIVLSFIVVALIIELRISILPADMHWFQYMNWMILSTAPQFAKLWYQRRCERAIDLSVGEIADPKAYVSALLRMGTALRAPETIPWWANLAHTHPPLWNRVFAVAAQYGFTDELERIRLSSHDPSAEDHYDVTYAQGDTTHT